MNEAKLIEKLKLIEALFAGATTPGERVAADAARLRILERLKTFEVADPPVEYKFTLGDLWARRVFVALLRRYDLKPYRYRGQRYTTVMVKVSKRFVDETLWPQFQQLSETLRTYLSEVTDRVVSQVLSEDLSEAVEVSEQQALPLSMAPAPEGATRPWQRRAAVVPVTGRARPTGPTRTGEKGGGGRRGDGERDDGTHRSSGPALGFPVVRRRKRGWHGTRLSPVPRRALLRW